MLDFIDIRHFGNSIFCRGGAVVQRPEAERLRGLWASGELQALAPDPKAPDSFVFRAGNGAEITTNNPKLAQYLVRMGAACPASLSLDEIAEDPDLAPLVLRLFVTKLLRVSAAQFSFTLTPGERPLASPLARF